MRKLAHSNDATMRKIESDALLRDDPTMYRCCGCGCGLACPEGKKPCDCATGVGLRMVGNLPEHIVLKVSKSETLLAFEEWARLPILNLNLERFPPMRNQVGGRPTYRDPTTEIACAAWFAGIASATHNA